LHGVGSGTGSFFLALAVAPAQAVDDKDAVKPGAGAQLGLCSSGEVGALSAGQAYCNRACFFYDNNS
jgi:hypothetical protein